MIILSRTYVQHEYNAQPAKKKSRTVRAIEFSLVILKNGRMKQFWPALAFAILVGCAPDRTLDTLIPRNALAVVLLDHPSLAVQAWGAEEAFPWKAVETGKPWAAAAVPANPPGLVLAVALAEVPQAWDQVARWARDRGGLNAVRLGTYVVLSSPGLPEPGVLDPDSRFDLERARAGGDPLAVYVDMKNLMAEANLPESLRPTMAFLPWAEKNLSGLRLGFAPRNGGLELRVATDWRPGSEAARAFQDWRVPVDPGSWSGSLAAQEGIGAVASLASASWEGFASLLPDRALARRWAALAPWIGPRVGVEWRPGSADAAGGWSVVLETRDPQAVRQALRTLVAGGELQKNFAAWAWDADTAVLYDDNPGTDGIRGTVTLGQTRIDVGYGKDRVVFAGGSGFSSVWDRWKTSPAPAGWVGQAPPTASALAAGSVDGLAARAAFRILADGNAEIRVWVDAAGLKAWEERLPQALLGWLSGEAGWTRWEP